MLQTQVKRSYNERVMRAKTSSLGFTIIELIVVIIIIALIAGAVLVSIDRSVRHSQYARARADIKQLITLIEAARSESNKTFGKITGHDCSECACRVGIDIRTLPKTHQCWINYQAAFNALNAAAAGGGVNIPALPQDPWGAPYLFNENEGEKCCCPNDPNTLTLGGCCTDNIFSAGADGRDYTADDINVNIPTLCRPNFGGYHPNTNW